MADAVIAAPQAEAQAAPQPQTPAPEEKPQAPRTPHEAALEVLRKMKEAKAAEEKPAEPGAAPAASTPSEEKPKPSVDAELEKINKAFRTLNKREAELRQRQEALKKEEADYAEYKKLKERAKLDPSAWLDHGGVEFDELVKAKASADGRPPNLEVLELREQVAQLQKKIDEGQKKIEEDKATSERRAAEKFVADYRGQLDRIASANTEKYDLIATEGEAAIDFALYVADQAALQQKRILPPEQVLDMVEQYLYDTNSEKLERSKKLRSKIAGPAPNGAQPQVSSGKAAQASPKKPPTLTNELQGNAPARDAIDPRKLTGPDRVRWALQAARRT